MDVPKQVVPIIVGPTAVGKTAVAIEIARQIPITVISADSRQVYRGLDIGTAKPTPEELRAVPHLGLDVVDPGTYYSAGRFASDAVEWIRSTPNNRQPIVVGGTGFYVRALAEGLFREPPMDKKRRARFSRGIEQMGFSPRFRLCRRRATKVGARGRGCSAHRAATFLVAATGSIGESNSTLVRSAHSTAGGAAQEN